MAEAITTTTRKKGRAGRNPESSAGRPHPSEECITQGRLLTRLAIRMSRWNASSTPERLVGGEQRGQRRQQQGGEGKPCFDRTDFGHGCECISTAHCERHRNGTWITWKEAFVQEPFCMVRQSGD